MAFIRKPGNIEKYLNDELGANLLYKYQALAVNNHLGELAEAARATMRKVLADEHKLTAQVEALVEDIVTFEVLRREDMFKGDYRPRTADLRHDVVKFLLAQNGTPLSEFILGEPRTCRFAHDQEQIDTIERAFHAYGRSTVGMTRIMVRFHVKSLLRRATWASAVTA